MIPRSVQLACICLLALLGKSPTVCAGEFEMLVLMHDSGRVERYELKTGKHLGTLLSGLPPSNAVLFDTELADISQEPEYIHRLYGTDSSDEHQRYYASQALRARRLVEAGVRFIEITCPSFDGNNSPWDQHGQLKVLHEKNARVTEQSVAALIKDLEQRGLLDETIVLWAGEMGRTPHTGAINENTGRDHHVSGFSIFLAGGGFKPGMAYGHTDEFGANAIENPMSVHDLHATILHQMGIDHEELTFRYGGRDHRLTDVHGHVIEGILG